MRRLANHGVPYLASLTPECNFAFLERREEAERFLPESDQEIWIEAGVSLFARAFERPPVTTCAPGYRANDTTFRIWRRYGLRVAQVLGRRGISQSRAIIILQRNVPFEPALDGAAVVEKAITDARRAAECGFPIIVCSHSINYISRFLGYADKGRRQLGDLLRGLLEAFPNLRFASDDDIASAWKANDQRWFRPATTREITARLRFCMPADASGR
jgi:hypothetical protein